jgi:hypothetical protein
VTEDQRGPGSVGEAQVRFGRTVRGVELKRGHLAILASTPPI